MAEEIKMLQKVEVNILENPKIRLVMQKPYEKEYQKYLFNIHCNGDIFAEYYRPFTYDEWIKNGNRIHRKYSYDGR